MVCLSLINRVQLIEFKIVFKNMDKKGGMLKNSHIIKPRTTVLPLQQLCILVAKSSLCSTLPTILWPIQPRKVVLIRLRNSLGLAMHKLGKPIVSLHHLLRAVTIELVGELIWIVGLLVISKGHLMPSVIVRKSVNTKEPIV